MKLGNNNVSVWHVILLKLSLITFPQRLQKNRLITHMNQKQGKKSKPVTSSNKLSTFPDKHKSDHEETSLKQPHHYAFIS